MSKRRAVFCTLAIWLALVVAFWVMSQPWFWAGVKWLALSLLGIAVMAWFVIANLGLYEWVRTLGEPIPYSPAEDHGMEDDDQCEGVIPS